jgi:hypothetical protein
MSLMESHRAMGGRVKYCSEVVKEPLSMTHHVTKVDSGHVHTNKERLPKVDVLRM